ncbi:hypothetical protein GOM49_09865 [Clostridium bovifaecis]|uniref:DUF3021 family protein n=1 Tax=Clostridium bovifaecis TaxID=2184719 RepID=A0A6I6ESG2_9CLOT|nr:hypothetical protein GOM49_09865 [Clostridium bovifaecis]
MFIKYSFGFLLASLVQAGIVMLFELLEISSLGATLTFMQLLTHIIAGQVAGYMLLFIVKLIESITKLSTLIIGSFWGIIIWSIIIPLNVTLGKIRAPWTQGTGTMFPSIIAFVVYGIIAHYTIKKYSHTNPEIKNY